MRRVVQVCQFACPYKTRWPFNLWMSLYPAHWGMKRKCRLHGASLSLKRCRSSGWRIWLSFPLLYVALAGWHLTLTLSLCVRDNGERSLHGTLEDSLKEAPRKQLQGGCKAWSSVSALKWRCPFFVLLKHNTAICLSSLNGTVIFKLIMSHLNVPSKAQWKGFVFRNKYFHTVCKISNHVFILKYFQKST